MFGSDLSPEARQLMASEHVDRLRRFAEPREPGRLRRRLGSALVGLGVLLGGSSLDPRSRHALPTMPDDAPAYAGASS